MSRLRAEMMPTVTVPPRPNGLPIAITQSPMRILSESPNLTAFSFFSFGSTLSTAMSVLVSVPTSSAFSLEPSEKLTSISSASAMTWLLVTTMPSAASTTKPEPSDWTFCWPPSPPSRSLKNSSKKSWNGDPSGACGSGTVPWPSLPLTLCEVEMLTTASSRPSARSATEAGPAWVTCGAAGAARRRGRRLGGRRRNSLRALVSVWANDGSCRYAGQQSHRRGQEHACAAQASDGGVSCGCSRSSRRNVVSRKPPGKRAGVMIARNKACLRL